MTITIRKDDQISDVDGRWFGARWQYNDDRRIPGAIWPMHPHKDIEGLTYVVEGIVDVAL